MRDASQHVGEGPVHLELRSELSISTASVSVW